MFFLFLFMLFGTASAESCGASVKCADPYKDVPDLVRCLISDAIPHNGVQKILIEMVTKMCKGETVDEIGKQFEKMIMKGADMTTVSKVLPIFGPIEKCLKSHKTTLAEQTQLIAKVIGQSSTVQKMAKIASTFKGRCNDQSMIDKISTMACPILTFDNVKSGMQSVKKNAGPAFECMKYTKKVAHVEDYGVL